MKNDTTLQQMLLGLEKWGGELSSSPLFSFYLKLLGIQVDIQTRISRPVLSLEKQEIEDSLKKGNPVAPFEKLDIDWPLFQESFRHIARLFSQHPEAAGEIPAALLALDVALPLEWVKAWFAGDETFVDALGGKFDAELVSTLIQHSMQPFMVVVAESVKGKYDQDLWRRSKCPVCGSHPDFAYLEPEVGARWVVCSNCYAEWMFKRMECPYCGNANHEKLSYLVSEDGLHRLYRCESCKSYLKAIDLRKSKEKRVPALESLTTVALDRQAIEAGYHRGGAGETGGS